MKSKIYAIAAGAIIMFGSPMMAEVGEFDIAAKVNPNTPAPNAAIYDEAFCQSRNPILADMHTQRCDQMNAFRAYLQSPAIENHTLGPVTQNNTTLYFSPIPVVQK